MERWACPTCSAAVETAYCPSCGERALGKHDLTLGGLAEQAVEAVSHLDGRLFRSFRKLSFEPGSLTVAYMRGQRKPFMAPLQLFLVANLFFFGLFSVAKVHIFSTPLSSQLHDQFYSVSARRMVTARLEQKHLSVKEYAPVFDHAVEVNAKSLVVLMVAPFTILTLLLFWRSRRPFAVHVVFALHFFAFMLLVFCAVLPIGFLAAMLGVPDGSGGWLDAGSMWLDMAIWAVYLSWATRTVFNTRGLARAVTVTLLTLASVLTIWGYRFVLFVITLYAT